MRDVYGDEESDAADDGDRVLARVGLQEAAFDQRVKGFSKGMRQKVGIAIAIIKGAGNVLLDEPTSGLDPKAAAEMMGLLRTLRDEGKAILMSTHDIFRARAHADRVGIMKSGRMVMLKTRQELEGEDLQELYLRYMQDEAPESGDRRELTGVASSA